MRRPETERRREAPARGQFKECRGEGYEEAEYRANSRRKTERTRDEAETRSPDTGQLGKYGAERRGAVMSELCGNRAERKQSGAKTERRPEAPGRGHLFPLLKPAFVCLSVRLSAHSFLHSDEWPVTAFQIQRHLKGLGDCAFAPFLGG